MFHSVKPLSDKALIPMNRDLEVTPEYLRDVVNMCREAGREIISLDEARDRIKAGLQSDRPFAVLTFDDGYKDNLTYAYPVLRELNAPFTVYLCTDFPDGKALLWWYLLEQKVRSTHKIELSINGAIKRYITATTSERLHAFHEIRYQLVTASSEERDNLLSQLFGNGREQWFEFTKAAALTWDEVRSLDRDPLCTIGAHTVTHPSLKQLDESQLQFEITESKRIIEQQIGKPVQHFCYPYGSPINCGEREFRAVESAGFATATTTTMSPLTHKSSSDIYALPRIPVRGTHESVELMRLLIEGSEIGEVLAIDEYVRDLQRRLFMVEQLGITSPSPDMHILL
jgi:peptidoglycan/xylan/chitin deacetylase (PgdA/CDA1 family)